MLASADFLGPSVMTVDLAIRIRPRNGRCSHFWNCILETIFVDSGIDLEEACREVSAFDYMKIFAPRSLLMSDSGECMVNCLEALISWNRNREYSAMKKLRVPTKAEPKAILRAKSTVMTLGPRKSADASINTVITPSVRPMVTGKTRFSLKCFLLYFL